MRYVKEFCFYNEEPVEASIDVCDVAGIHVVMVKSLSRPVSKRASMSLDGASMAYEMLQEPLFLK